MTRRNHVAVHAALPLAVLEAVQELDAPVRDGLDEFHQDLSAKRLGLSRTVAQQVERFGRLARADARVPRDDLIALLRLVGRREDAGLIFTAAGRRAGQFAVRRARVARVLGRRVGFGVARRRSGAVLGVRLERAGAVATATLEDAPSVRATDDGAACAFYGAGLAEILRRLTDFDGAMLHVRCGGRGDDVCRWETSGAPGAPEPEKP